MLTNLFKDMTSARTVSLLFSLILSISLYAESEIESKIITDPDLFYTLKIPYDWDIDVSFNLSDRRCIIYTDRNTTITVNARITRYIESEEGLNNIINELVVYSDLVSEKKIKGLNEKIRMYNGARGISFMVAYVQNNLYTLFIVETGVNNPDFYLPTLIKNATFYNSKSRSMTWYIVGTALTILISALLWFSIQKRKKRRKGDV